MAEVIIRQASLNDVSSIQQIYAYYVHQTAITFEYEVPSVTEMTRRMKETVKKYPYLVAVCDDQVVGYAYAGSFYERAAYDWTCELSIYVDRHFTHQRIGSQLYEKMEEILKQMGILNLYACITSQSDDEKDPHITDHSVRFHQHAGFKLCGTFEKCGYKFGHWYDMVYMVKMIGDHKKDQPPVISYSQYLKLGEQ